MRNDFCSPLRGFLPGLPRTAVFERVLTDTGPLLFSVAIRQERETRLLGKITFLMLFSRQKLLQNEEQKAQQEWLMLDASLVEDKRLCKTAEEKQVCCELLE